mmetsp:Transcript_61373/g.146209  ORF Transcript_61373/g.146209 Transcript_61373/m.146209 type:complete len:371 (-) Transcript_61373:187-1299(-)|eukprot:CAMPEP_0178408790 /NCGR_PEP_ID=MMETSP0689_2-20121128/20124_1 /TAXON_ID=160604 /ORGANISM="Amphidinium massartii, Strain CS-259" /LENGTH=370 /DNA_ID=CAMNT_0020029903 /DNA_START=52 /DNA_END=1164 /DNA_ORIENTATION=-
MSALQPAGAAPVAFLSSSPQTLRAAPTAPAAAAQWSTASSSGSGKPAQASSTLPASAALLAAGAACAGLRPKARKAASGRGSARLVQRRAGGAGPIETFLVQGDVNVAKLSMACAPLANHFDLDGIVFFTLGVSPETVASVAGGALGLHGVCPVFIADSYGIVGWDKAAKANVELMEEGRGSEYGCVGGKGGKGVVVAAFRGGHIPSEEKLPENCGVHMMVTADGKPEHQPSGGSVYGGVAKACYKLEHSGDLVSVPGFAVSTPNGVVTSFAGEASDAAKAAVGAIPDSAAPATAGYFPCFCRGVNKYGEDNVEPAAFASNGMSEVPLFGMFAHGELGPPQGEPVVSASESKPSEVEMHSSTSVLALYPA